MRSLLVLTLMLTAAAAVAQEPRVRPAENSDSYEYSVAALRALVDDPAVVTFRLELDWLGGDTLQASLVAIDADAQARGAVPGTFADRVFDAATIAAMDDVTDAVRNAQVPELAMHILHPHTASTYVTEWMALRQSGAPLAPAMAHSGEPLRYFNIDKAMVADIVNRAETTALVVFWGLNDAGTLAPVLAGSDGQNAAMIGSTADIGFALDFSQPCPPMCNGGGLAE